MKTGPHSFTDATGVEWHIEGYSRVCGPAYVDCRSADGKALTVRPLAYLGPSGLSLPPDAPPPVRKATGAEKRAAAESAERTLKTAPSLEVPGQEAEGTPQATGAGGADSHERACGCARCYKERQGTLWPPQTYPTAEAMLDEAPHPLQVAAEHVGVPVKIPAPHPADCACATCAPDNVIAMPPRYADATEAWAMADPALAGLVEYAPGEWGFPEHE